MADLSKLKICSFNASGLRVKQKFLTILNYMKNRKMDVILLQETHLVDDDINYIKKVWKGEFHLSGDTRNSKGVLTLFAKHIPKASIELVNMTDRVIVSRLWSTDYPERQFIIINVYAPNDDPERQIFLTHLLGHLKDIKMKYPDLFFICAGDFNAVHDNNLDIISGKKHPQGLVDTFKKLIDENLLIDSWRDRHGTEKMYTWKRGKISRRLDYILIDEGLNAFMRDTDIESIGFSDHLLVSTHLQLNGFKFGNSYYKMNVSVLKDMKYVNLMRKKIPEFLKENENLDPHLKWEMTKIQISEFTQKYCRAIQFEKGREKNETRKLLNDIEKELAREPNNENLMQKQAHLKEKWEAILIEETRGIQIRSGIKWMEEGEKSSKFFLGLEKSRAMNNTIFELNVAGKKIFGETEILKEIGNYYEKLYMEENETNSNLDRFNEYIDDLVIPTISKEDSEACEEEITMEEMGEAILKMNNGSAPGSDGIPVEFYKIFFNDIKHILFDTFRFSFQNSTLPISQQKGIVSLLHKGKGLDKDNLDNWRPLSLTNADYKILAKIIARRIQNVLDDIIHSDQCGFVKGRDIANLLREIDDILENNKDRENEFILLAIDYRKAFDTIRNDFIMQCLDLVGFQENMKKWIHIILHNRTFCVKNGGHISGIYRMHRGVRQGCPLSPLLFIIAIELLGISIRQSEKIKGITVYVKHHPVTHKIKQYADDTTFLLKDMIDFKEVLSRIKAFAEISGLHMNKNKTVAMRVSNKNNTDIEEYEDIKFVQEIKLLGLYFSNEKSARSNEKNWESKIEKLLHNLTLWSRRNLTLFGKVTIIKTFGLSQFIYIMKSIGLPKNILQKVNKILFSFIWGKDFKSGNTVEKIKRKVICRDIELGGLNMIDINDMQATFYIKWALKLLTEKNQPWTATPIQILESVGGDTFLLCDIKEKQIVGMENIRSEFWKDVVLTWLKQNENGKILHLDSLRIIDRPLFNNNNITYKGKPLYLEKTLKKGVLSVRDFVKEGNLITIDDFLYKVGYYPRANLDYFVIFNALRHVNLQEKEDGMLNCNERAREILSRSNKMNRLLIRDDDNSLAIGHQMWNRKLGQDISIKYKATLTCTKEIKLKEFIFKIFHNIFPSNFMLERMKLSATNTCDFCGEVDYTEHALVNCVRLKQFWEAVIKWIKKEVGIDVADKTEEKLFGIGKGDRKKTKAKNVAIANQILLIAKFSIYKTKFYDHQNITVIFEEEISKRKKYLRL